MSEPSLPTNPTEVPNQKYWAFLSYSRKDKKEATRLHRRLETFRVPNRLVGKQTPVGIVPRRLFPIFRDDEEFSTSSHLSNSIDEALRSSRNLIVLGSPYSAVSKWVNEEVIRFRKLGGSSRIMAVILSGVPRAKAEAGEPECFPPALRFNPAEGDIQEDLEPLASDFRSRGKARNKEFIRVVAGLLELPFDELWQREQRRKRLQLLATIIFVFVAVLAMGCSLYANKRQRDGLHAKEQARMEMEKGHPDRALPWIREALSKGRDDASLRFLLGEALDTYDNLASTLKSEMPGEVLFGGFSNDGSLLLMRQVGKPWTVMESSTGKTMTVIEDSNKADQARLSPDGRYVLIHAAERLIIKDWIRQTVVSELSGHKMDIMDFAVSPAGDVIATGSMDNTVRLWTFPEGKFLRTLEGHTGGVRCTRWNPTGTMLASTGADKSVRLWNPLTGESVAELEGLEETGISLEFSSEGERLIAIGLSQKVAATYDLRLRKFAARREFPLPILCGLPRGLYSEDSVIWTKGSEAIVSGISTGAEYLQLRGHQGQVAVAEVSSDHRLAITGSWDGTLRVWDLRNGSSLRSYKMDTGNSPVSVNIQHLAVSRRMDRIAAANWSGTLGIWKTPEHLAFIPGSPDKQGRIRSFAELTGVKFQSSVSPDASRIACAGGTFVSVWSAVKGELVGTLDLAPRGCGSLSFSSDGRLVLIFTTDRRWLLWNPESGDQKIIPDIQHAIFDLTPENLLLVTGNDGTLATLDPATLEKRGHWKLDTGEAVVSTLPNRKSDDLMLVHQSGATSLFSRSSRNRLPLTEATLNHEKKGHMPLLSFSPDCKSVAIGHQHQIEIFSVLSGKKLRSFGDPELSLSGLSFDSAGKRLVTWGFSPLIYVWDVSSGKQLYAIRSGCSTTNGAFFHGADNEFLICIAGVVQIRETRSGVFLTSLSGTSGIPLGTDKVLLDRAGAAYIKAFPHSDLSADSLGKRLPTLSSWIVSNGELSSQTQPANAILPKP